MAGRAEGHARRVGIEVAAFYRGRALALRDEAARLAADEDHVGSRYCLWAAVLLEHAAQRELEGELKR